MPEPTEPERDRLSGVIPLVFWAVVILGITWYSDTGRAFLLRQKWYLGGGLVVLLALLLWEPVRERLSQASPRGRLALVIYVLAPLLVVLVLAVAFLPPQYRELALRSVFLVVVCLLPATMFYLFIFTRKDSLLNEFVANLDRLGLLGGRRPTFFSRNTALEARQRKLYTYLLRFQAAYGPLRKSQVQPILEEGLSAPGQSGRSWDSTSFSDTGSIIALETTVPVIIATVLIALGWLITLPPWGELRETHSPGDWLRSLAPQSNAISFAFLGAYLFSLQMLFRRYVRRDLRPNAYMAVSLRIIAAVLGTWGALQAIRLLWTELSADQQYVLGFTIGFFPRVAWQIIEAATKKISGFVLRLPSLKNPLPLAELAGLSVWHEARLEEEDIENIPNMATADIAELMLTTRFPPDRIIDWVDEAILRTALGPDARQGGAPAARAILAAHGIRTASGLLTAHAQQNDPPVRAVFEKLLPAAADQPSPVRSLVLTLNTNPNLELIQRWRGLLTEIEAAPPLTAAETAAGPTP